MRGTVGSEIAEETTTPAVHEGGAARSGMLPVWRETGPSDLFAWT